MYWGFGLVVATLYTLLDVLVRFDATCRLEMILGSFFAIVRRCDLESLESVRDHAKATRYSAMGVGGGKWIRVLTIHQTAWRMKGWRTRRDQRRALPLLVVVEVLDTVRSIVTEAHR